jgi:hypothetical protein
MTHKRLGKNDMFKREPAVCMVCKQDKELRYMDDGRSEPMCEGCATARGKKLEWGHAEFVRDKDIDLYVEGAGKRCPVKKEARKHVHKFVTVYATKHLTGKDGYAIDDEGRVFKDGKHIGDYADQVNVNMQEVSSIGIRFFNRISQHHSTIAPFTLSEIQGMSCESYEVTNND